MKKPNWYMKAYMIDEIKELAKNPRTLTQKAKTDIKKSMDKFGLIDKPIVNLDGQLIGGHQRLHILKSDGVKTVDCWTPDRLLSEKEVEELNIRLNKNSASWDFDILANEWDIDALTEWGFSNDELGLQEHDLLSDTETKAETQSDETVSQEGDTWQLWQHTVMCVDAKDIDGVLKLLKKDDPVCIVADQKTCDSIVFKWQNESGLVPKRNGKEIIEVKNA